MPNTVLKYPWMRPEDAVPYVAPPELFRNDSPCPPPAKTTVPICWVSDVIKTTPVKKVKAIDNVDPKNAPSSPIPCMLSPVPIMPSPPSPAAPPTAHHLPIMTKSISCEALDRVHAISPTDSTQIGDLQLDEEEQRATTALFRSFESAFEQVPAKDGTAAANDKSVEDDKSVAADMSSVASAEQAQANDTAILVTPPKTGNAVADGLLDTPQATIDEPSYEDLTVVTNASVSQTDSPIHDNVDLSVSDAVATHAGYDASLDSTIDIESTFAATTEDELNVTIVSCDSETKEDVSSGSAKQEFTGDGSVKAYNGTPFPVNDEADVATSSLTSTLPASDGNSPASSKSRLLVLLDMKSCSQTIVANQLYMFTVFSCSRIQYDKVDVSDPAHAELRDRLLSLSGEQSPYPQFFLENTDGSVSFWGGWDRFFHTADDSRRLVLEFRQAARNNCRQ